MVIHGLQKMTLLDFPGKVACTVFTAGCNFRCPFCHNARLVTETEASDEISAKTVLSFLKKRVGLLDGICITGGEPLMHRDIDGFMRAVKDMGFLIKLDTNGSFPERLSALIDEGLPDYVAMDIKNSKEKYAMTAGCTPDLLPRIEESVARLMQGQVDFEFRTTVMEEFHTPADIYAIGQWIAGAPRYFIQSFNDSGDLIEKRTFTAPSASVLNDMLNAVRPFVPAAALRGV